MLTGLAPRSLDHEPRSKDRLRTAQQHAHWAEASVSPVTFGHPPGARFTNAVALEQPPTIVLIRAMLISSSGPKLG